MELYERARCSFCAFFRYFTKIVSTAASVLGSTVISCDDLRLCENTHALYIHVVCLKKRQFKAQKSLCRL